VRDTPAPVGGWRHGAGTSRGRTRTAWGGVECAPRPGPDRSRPWAHARAGWGALEPHLRGVGPLHTSSLTPPARRAQGVTPPPPHPIPHARTPSSPPLPWCLVEEEIRRPPVRPHHLSGSPLLPRPRRHSAPPRILPSSAASLPGGHPPAPPRAEPRRGPGGTAPARAGGRHRRFTAAHHVGACW
jgi:hypothetical protein